ncbi:MAG: hypothetical protein KDD49_14220 [Bacteroidetes bacterium]|nr:hypothetical protein [Bacteroidota bacterium]MCB9043295.1 hypothetical protein [Chitinophagales bacterium]
MNCSRAWLIIKHVSPICKMQLAISLFAGFIERLISFAR